MQTSEYTCWTGTSTYVLQRSPSPTMTLSPPGTPRTSSGIRRHRRTTACTTCRDRRVKCSRERPSCTQCQKGGRSCKYLNSETPEFEFIQVKAPRKISKSPSPPMEQWKPVVERHFESIKNLKAVAPSPGNKIWVVNAKDNLPSIHSPELLDFKSQPSTYRLRTLDDRFVPNFQARLPAREVCDHFLANFLLGIQPLIPVCHVPSLEKSYLEFWQNISPNTSIESVLVILAVLYTGAANSTINISQSSTLHKLYTELESVVDIPTYRIHNRSCALQLLQACIIMNTFQATNASTRSHHTFLAQAIQLARSLNLHIDRPGQYSDDLAVQNRIWWHLMFLDMESTIASGSHGIIRQDEYTTRLPSLSAEYTAGKKTSSQYSIMVAFQGQLHWTHRMQSWYHRMPNQNEVSSFIRLIDSLLELIPEGREENEWPRAYLKLLIDRAYCMVGLKFWLSDQFGSTCCNSDVLRASRSFLYNYNLLSSLPQASHLKWFISSFVQPHHSLFILLMHLNSCKSLETETRLSGPLIEKTFTLLLPITSQTTATFSSSPSPSLRSISSTSTSPYYEQPLSTIPNHRDEYIIKLYNRTWKKLHWNIESRPIQQRSPSCSPRMGVLPQLEELIEKERRLSRGSGWMELVTCDRELFGIDKAIEDIVRDGTTKESWQKLAGTIFTN